MHARKTVEWLEKSVVYQIYLRAFTPEGTFKAAMRHLPAIAELGADIVYLASTAGHDDDMDMTYWSPRQKSSGFNNPKNPYRVKDYFNIDSEYGTDEDLREFVKIAHSLGMKVLLDLVYFHCGPAAVFLKEHPDFVRRSETGEMLRGKWSFPELNFENPELREYLYRNMEYWITEFAVDGYRCDASDELPLDFWEEGRTRIEKIKPDVIMLSEADKRKEDQRHAFDFNYDFAWSSTLRQVISEPCPASLIRGNWNKNLERSLEGARYIHFIDSHDLANDDTTRLESKWSNEAIEAALMLVFTMDGIPFLYNGQEIKDSAKHSIFAKLPIDWDMAKTTQGIERLAFCKKLCTLRHEEEALATGKLIWLENNSPDSVVSFIRKTADNEFLVIVNLSDAKVKTTIDMTPVNPVPPRNAIFSKNVSISNNDQRCQEYELAPFAYYAAK